MEENHAYIMIYFKSNTTGQKNKIKKINVM